MTANDFSQEHQSESTAIKVPPLKLDGMFHFFIFEFFMYIH